MDINVIRGLGTVFALFAFLCIVAWAYSSRHKSRFEDDAMIPFKEDEINENSERELLVDVTNVISSACLLGIGEQLEIELGLTAPSVLGQQIPIDRLLADQMTWKHALMVEINYSVDDRAFKCHLLMMMPETALIALTERLDNILDEF